MAILCKEYGLFFIQIGATGSSSIGNVLTKQYGGVPFPYEEATTADGETYNRLKHVTLAEIKSQQLVPESDLASYLKFASIRNPYDFLVSGYAKDRLQRLYGVRDKKALPKGIKVDDMEPDPRDFTRWIDNRMGRRRTIKELLKGRLRDNKRHPFPGLVGVDHVVRLEHMIDDLNKIMQLVGAPPVDEVKNVNAGYRSSYQLYYSPHAKKLVDRYYGFVIEQFGYEF